MRGDGSDEREEERRFGRRALLMGGAQVAAFSVLGGRLFKLQVMDSGRYTPLAEDNRINFQVLAPKRGRLLDMRGRLLADNEEVFRVSLTPALAGDTIAVLTELRKILPLSLDDAEKIVRRTKRQSRNLPTIVANDISFESVARLNVLAPQLPGVRTETIWRRRYHGAEDVGHIVGYVGSVERHGVDDDAVMRLPEMRIGKTGAEAGFEMELRGSGGAQKIEVDARGRIVRNLDATDAAPGRDIYLSIDQDLQTQILERLRQERRAACVVLDVKSGEIAAMCSTPGFKVADVAEGASEEAWQRLANSEDRPLLNRAIAGQYPPGSTFKIVTALAGLQAGMITPNDSFDCDGHFEYADQTLRCWNRSGHGRMKLHDALRASCDVFFFETARKLGIELLADTARLMGLGQVYDCGLPEQKSGLVPDPDWKRGKMNAAWLGGETLLTGIGQGYVLSTPLQLAVMTARIATGRVVVPTLTKHAAGTPLPEFATLGIDERHLAAVREGLVAVVNAVGGTGHNAQLGEGQPQVAGKTGTSQVSRLSSETAQDNLEWAQRDHALFVGYVPAQTPRYAVAAVVEHGGGGGATAAPLVRDVILKLLDRDTRDGRASGVAPAPATPAREG